MAVAVHINNTPKDPSVLLILILRIANAYPAEHFVLFVSKKEKQELQLPANCEAIPVVPPIKNHLLRYYWYQLKLPGLLEKHNICYFIGEHNSCSLKVATPQAIFVKHLPADKNKNQDKYFLRCYDKAATLFIANPLLKKQLSQKHPLLQEKTTFLYPGIEGASLPLTIEKKEQVLREHTNEHEFFIYESQRDFPDDKIIVLKAFSLFKKRLKSSMQLVIIDRPGAAPIPDFKNYKYRAEVTIISTENEEISGLLKSAAYAALFLPPAQNTTATALHYLSTGVPLIVSDHEFNHLVYQDAALYSQAVDTHLAGQIMQVYKDETLRNALIEKGLALAAKYSWDESCRQISESILPADRV